MTMKRRAYFRVFSLLGLFFCFAPTAYGRAFTLDECVALALRNNPDLQQQQMNLSLSGADLTDRKRQKLGRLDLVSSYTHYNLPRTLAPLTPGSIISNPSSVPTTENLFTTGIVYQVPLFTGFAQTRSVEIAHLQKQLSAAALTLSREQLIYNVKTVYVNILSLQKQARAQAAFVASLQRLYEQVSQSLELGRLARIDQLKAASELERARSGLTQINANIRILKASLASLLNLEQVPPLQEIDLSAESVRPVQNRFAERLDTLERLQTARLTVRKNDKQADRVAAALYPQIVLNTSYSQSFGPNDGSHPDSGEWNRQEVWQAGVNLQWNLFDFGSTRSKLKKARIVARQSRYRQTQTELELKRALEEAVTRVNTAVSDYQSARTERDTTHETAAIEQVRFDQGAASINDLLTAKARDQLAESRFIAAGYTYQTARFQLEYLLEMGEQK